MNHKKYGVVLTKDKKNEVVDISLDIENDVIDTEINVASRHPEYILLMSEAL